MAHETDVRDRSKAKMEASNYKANGIFAKELEDELMKFTSKCEDYESRLVEQTKEVHRNDDMEVNITECTKSLGNEVVEAERHDTTENSSSFDDSDCGVENVDALGDFEAMSDFCGDASPSVDFDGFGEMFRTRKKKPTAHWRSYIQPLMWRCKWVELQIKKLQSQAQQYDRELEAYNKSKQIQLEKDSTLEGECAKSLPFSRVDAKNEVLRRKKRKRAEATTDVAAYMSRHNLFSYYENRKSFTEGAFMDNELKNMAIQKVNIDDEFWVNDEPFFTKPGDGDNSLEHVLRKIELLQSQVGKMKRRVDAVMSENAGKFSCIDDISLPMLPSQTFPPNNWDIMPARTYIASQLSTEYNTGDVLVPESASASTSHGDVRDVNGSTSHARFADAYLNGEDGVLIDNRRVKEEMNTFEEVKIHPIQRPLVLKEEPSNPSPPVLAGPDLPTDDHPSPKTRSISKITTPKSKRKRGRRRGSGRWSRRSVG
ncbi:hypothetical protein BUALT_Bualt01G0198000 [Buddleja alternifolia]|uniref:Uncharacterized protein n=1 Tax=Buddleja alternifolia TaxID=168488 RepID=A0AAV6YG93_9LAMI|nr:hypothetical protein BUALT_Bualt01G0198000 [Buddleja alternifolia]